MISTILLAVLAVLAVRAACYESLSLAIRVSRAALAALAESLGLAERARVAQANRMRAKLPSRLRFYLFCFYLLYKVS